jgi:hypothetical protein
MIARAIQRLFDVTPSLRVTGGAGVTTFVGSSGATASIARVRLGAETRVGIIAIAA